MISLEIFQQLAQSTNDVITVTAAAPLGPPGPIIVYVNPAFTALTGYDANEVIGQSTRLLHGPKTDPRTVADVRAAMEAQRPIRVEQLHYKHDGEEFWIDTNIVPLRDTRGRVSHFATIGRDLTATKQLQEELRLMANTDPLTGLFNRRRFLEQADTEFLRSQRYQHELAAMMLDIDHFKTINDTHGHFVGDQVLIAMSCATENLLRGTDILGRWGGEEFVILMPETPLAGAAILAERLREVLAQLAIALYRQRRSRGAWRTGHGHYRHSATCRRRAVRSQTARPQPHSGTGCRGMLHRLSVREVTPTFE
jgi:diguanylate cyclase (GGDEF)-like protein/PAS domain S-box-containing protein